MKPHMHLRVALISLICRCTILMKFFILLGSGPSSRRGSLFDDSRRPSLLINDEVSIVITGYG